MTCLRLRQDAWTKSGFLKLQREGHLGPHPHSSGPRGPHSWGATPSPGLLFTWTEGHLPEEMQPPLNPNSLSRQGWGLGGGVGWGGVGGGLWQPGASRSAPDPSPQALLLQPWLMSPFLRPISSFSKKSHTTFLLETGSNPPSRKQRTCLRAAPWGGPQQVAGQCPPASAPTPRAERALLGRGTAVHGVCRVRTTPGSEWPQRCLRVEWTNLPRSNQSVHICSPTPVAAENRLQALHQVCRRERPRDSCRHLLTSIY